MSTDTLTPAQRAVFERLVLGETNKEIGQGLGLAEKTIKAHVTAIFKAFKCTSRARIIAHYYTTRSCMHEQA